MALSGPSRLQVSLERNWSSLAGKRKVPAEVCRRQDQTPSPYPLGPQIWTAALLNDPAGPEFTVAVAAPKTRRDDASNAIRRAILQGDLPRGTRLKEAVLAAALQVSRPTLREAIRTLVYEGLVIEEPFKGARVADPSPQSILEVAAVRVALEALACHTVASQLDYSRLDALETALGEIITARYAVDALRLAAAHRAFHRAIVHSAQNALLQQVWQWLEGHISLALTVDQIVHPDFDRMVNTHQSYLKVIRLGKPDEITDEVRRHILDQAHESASWGGR